MSTTDIRTRMSQYATMADARAYRILCDADAYDGTPESMREAGDWWLEHAEKIRAQRERNGIDGPDGPKPVA